tara:strand:- start:109 stop:774 length:666 start_codon:yes stop_codon:yes gene_type:complete
MKRLSLLLLIVGLIIICSQSSTAQENKNKKEAKVKVLINKDGKTVKFDTIIHEFKDHKEIMKIIKSKHLSDSLFEIIEGEDFMWISDDKDSHRKHKVIVKEFHSDDSSLHSKMRKHIKIISDEGENIIIHDGDGKHKTISIEISDEDGNVHMKHEDGKKIFIIKEDIDMDISKDGDMTIIKIDCQSDNDEDFNIEVEVTDDGKKIKKIKKKKVRKAKKEEK